MARDPCSRTTDAGDCAVRASGLHRRSHATQEVGLDPIRFDRFAIVVGQRSTRRTAVGLLAALSLSGLGRSQPAAAATCTLKANGDRCTTGTDCCSGR